MINQSTYHKATALRFSPTAWAKLLFLRDAGDTEIGGFGITAEGDLLLVQDVGLVLQTCSRVHVAFDDHSVADFFDEQVDAGRQLAQFARIWVHTHPGDSPRPSVTDEQTFARVFGRADWAVMFILAIGGQTYARLRFNTGPGAEFVIPVDVDYSRPFDATDFERWREQYEALVRTPQVDPDPESLGMLSPASAGASDRDLHWWDDERADVDWYEVWHDDAYLDETEQELDELEYLRDY